MSKKIKFKDLLKNKEIKRNIKILTKFKNFILIIINNEVGKEKTDTNYTLRYYGIGAQIIKDFKVRNMILLSRSKKDNWFRGFWFKNKKANYYKMKKILIVEANYYNEITRMLVLAAKNELKKRKYRVSLLNVPGILEIPVTIKKNIKKFDAFVALGCVIKGKTPHFDFICKSSFDAILNLSIKYEKIIGNGIITALNKSKPLNDVVKKNLINQIKDWKLLKLFCPF